MSRVLSVSDLLHFVDEFKGMNEVQLIHPDNDKRVLHYLGDLGFDTDYTIYYMPNKHRNLRGEINVGYRLIGELNCNRKFYEIYSLEEIVACTSYQDLSLTRELCNLSGKDLDYKSFNNGVASEVHHKKFPETEWAEDYLEVKAQINQLQFILEQVRGSYYNEDGSVKGLGQ